VHFCDELERTSSLPEGEGGEGIKIKYMIKKGDNVKVIAGADKGKTGKVLQVFPKLEQVLVEGVNLKTKNVKAKRDGEKGTIVKKANPIHISNVAATK
jgi:large subunit ribosomal protein L24